VIDFSVIKEVVGKWIDDNWDHGMILCSEDPVAQAIPRGHKMYLMSTNPTAEGMASHLLHVSNRLLLDHAKETNRMPVRVVKVCLWETENCYAEVDDVRS